MKDAQKKITEHTGSRQMPFREKPEEKKTEYSLIFAHAQDTLMTIYSEINIAKQMIKIFESWEKRLKRLENQE